MISAYEGVRRLQSSHLVRLVIDFPYMSKERARDMEFSDEYLIIKEAQRKALTNHYLGRRDGEDNQPGQADVVGSLNRGDRL